MDQRFHSNGVSYVVSHVEDLDFLSFFRYPDRLEKRWMQKYGK